MFFKLIYIFAFMHFGIIINISIAAGSNGYTLVNIYFYKIFHLYESPSKFIIYPQIIGYLKSPLSFYMILNNWGIKMYHSAQKCFYT